MTSELTGLPLNEFDVENPYQVTTVKRLHQIECGISTNPIENIDILKNCFLIAYRNVRDIPFIFDYSSLFFDFVWKNWVSSIEQEPYIIYNNSDYIEFNRPVKIPSTKEISVFFEIKEVEIGTFRAAKE